MQSREEKGISHNEGYKKSWVSWKHANQQPQNTTRSWKKCLTNARTSVLKLSGS